MKLKKRTLECRNEFAANLNIYYIKPKKISAKRVYVAVSLHPVYLFILNLHPKPHIYAY
jgi:hypothetical protein